MKGHKISKQEYLYFFDKQSGLCVVCFQPLEGGDFGWTGFGAHHIKKKSQGGDESRDNLVLVHNYCNGWIEDNPEKARKLNLVKVKSSEDL